MIVQRILEHNKERIVQLFDGRRKMLSVILQETVVDVKHFNLQKTRLTIHLTRWDFRKKKINDPFLLRDGMVSAKLSVSQVVSTLSRFGETQSVATLKNECSTSIRRRQIGSTHDYCTVLEEQSELALLDGRIIFKQLLSQ